MINTHFKPTKDTRIIHRYIILIKIFSYNLYSKEIKWIFAKNANDCTTHKMWVLKKSQFDRWFMVDQLNTTKLSHQRLNIGGPFTSLFVPSGKIQVVMKPLLLCRKLFSWVLFISSLLHVGRVWKSLSTV